MQRRLMAIALLVLLGGASFILLLQPEQPENEFAQFFNPDGSFTIPAGADWKKLLDYLNKPKPSLTTDWTVWTPRESIYPTADYEGFKFSTPNLGVYVPRPRDDYRLLDRIADWLGTDQMVKDLKWFFSLDWLIGRVSATVAFDAAAESERIGTTDPHTWTHTPVGTPRAIAVLTSHGVTATDHVLSCTYGLVAMTLVIEAQDAATEPGATRIFFLGAGIPTGAQTVSCDLDSATGDDIHFVSLSFTAATDTEVGVTASDNDNQANPSAVLAYASRSRLAVMIFYSGAAAPPGTTACSGNSTCTLSHTMDQGAFGDSAAYQTTAGTADQTMGWTQATDDVAVAYAAISEIVLQSDWYLVLGDADCTVTAIGTDAGCWAATSGGAAPTSVPTAASNVFMDGPSGAGTGTLDANMNVTTGTYSSAGFTGTFALATFTFQNTGTFTHSGGTITVSTGILDVGASTVSAALTTSGAAAITMDSLTLSASTISKGTASLTIQGNLTMSGGDITSTSGAGSVTGDVNISSVTSSIDFGSETWTISGTWTNATTEAAWDAGTGTVTFDDATAGTMTFAGANLVEAEFNSVTFNSTAGTAQTFTMATRGLRLLSTLSITDASSTTTLATTDLAIGAAADTADLSVGNGGIFTANASTVILGTVTMTGGTTGTITVTTGVWTVSGNWNTSGVGSVYTQGTGIVTFDATATITLLSTDNTFDDLTISAGTVTLATAVVVTNALTISGGTFAKSTFAITSAGSLTMSGGDLTSTSGDVAITGAANISSAASAIDFGSEAWTVSGTWTNASTDGTVWEAGTGTVTFDSATGGTMTFAGANLAESEFNNATFNSTGGTAQTFTMATRSLRIGATLTVTDSTSTTTLDTANLNLQATTVDCLTNGIILIGTGDFIGLVTFNIDGSLTMNAIVVSNMNIARTAGTGTIDITLWTAWAVGCAGAVDVRWTFSPSVAGDTWQFVLEDVCASTSYNLLRNGIIIDTQTSVGTVVTLSELGGWAAGDAMQINEAPTNRFLVLGDLECTVTTVSTDADCWSTTSGGNGNGVPIAGDNLFMDALSGAGTGTMDASLLMVDGTINTTGFTGTFAIVTFTLSTTGAFTHAGGTITLSTGSLDVGVSTVSASITTSGVASLLFDGLTISGSTIAKGTATLSIAGGLTMSGGDLTSTSGTVTITGAVSISSAASAIDFGSEAWTVSGTWTNASTDAAWDAGTGTVTFDSATGGTMTFAGTNLAEDEFNNVTFTSSAGTEQTFTMATRGLRLGGTLTVNDTVSNTILDTSVSNLAITTGILTVGPSNGQLTANGSTITVSGNAVFTGGAFVEGTSTLVLAATGTLTMDVAGTRAVNNLFNLTINVGITTTLGVDIGIGQVLTLNGTITGASRTIFFSSTSAAPLVLGGSHSFGVIVTVLLASTVDYSVPASTGYPTLDIESDGAATATLAGDITATTIEIASVPSAITLAANSRTITLTQGIVLTTTGSGLTFTTGVLDTGTVGTSIISLGTFIQWGSGSHFISGGYTNNTTSASWDAGTGTVTFDNPTGGTVTFAGSNLAEAEFNNATFTSSAGTAQTFTMATRGLRWLTTLTVSDTVSTTALATADLALGVAVDAADIVVGNGGILTANASTVLVNGVTMTGGTSGIITVTSGAWTVSGNWNTSGVGSTYTQGTGIVTFDATATITMLAADNVFDDLTISAGTATLAQAIVVTNIVTVTSTLTSTNLNLTATTIEVGTLGTLTMGTGNLLDFTTLNIDGQMTMDGITINNGVNISADLGNMDLTLWTLYTPATEITWTLDPSTAGATVTFIIDGLTASTSYDLLRDAIVIDTQTSNGSGQATFSETSGWSPHTMSIQPTPTGGTGCPGTCPGGGTGSLRFTWQHLSKDLTVILTVPSASQVWTFEWYLEGRKIGEGDTIQWTFERSGTYRIDLYARHPNGRTVQAWADVTAVSLSFFGRYMPVLLLMVLAVWYWCLVVAGRYKKDNTRVAATFFGFALMAIAMGLASADFYTLRVGGFEAIKLYLAAFFVGAAGSIKNKAGRIMFYAIGVGLLTLGILYILPGFQ